MEENMSSISTVFGYVLNYIYGLVQNYGFAIIIFSVLLKIVLLPLSIKQQKTMKKTTEVQGKMEEIREKYKNDQVKMNQETLELYKKEKISPFGGCLTSILQIILLLIYEQMDHLIYHWNHALMLLWHVVLPFLNHHQCLSQ